MSKTLFALAATAAVLITTSPALAQPGSDFQDRGIRDEAGLADLPAWYAYRFSGDYNTYAGPQYRAYAGPYSNVAESNRTYSGPYRSYGGNLRLSPLHVGPY